MVAGQKSIDSPAGLQFAQMLPRLVAAYEKGLLVPFIGAGMSVDVCTDWPYFIYALEDRVEKPDSTSGHRNARIRAKVESEEQPTSEELIRRMLDKRS